MRKRNKKICKGHVKVTSILMSFFSFSFKNTLPLCLFILLFSILSFDFTMYFYLGNINWEIGQIGKTAFTVEFLTVANTLKGSTTDSNLKEDI